MEIKITHVIGIDTIESLLDSACRGASYWAQSELQYENEVKALMRGETVRILDTESDPETLHDLTLEKVQTGLALMAQKAPQDFADILTGDSDNNTGDTFLQFCLFGELVYS